MENVAHDKLGDIGRQASRGLVDSLTLSCFLDRARLGRFSTLALLVSIALTGVIAYLPAIDNFFISDDFTLLRFVEDLSKSPGAIWGSVSEFFRLVSYVYFAAALNLFGLRPEPYYWSSISLHIAVSLLVFALVRAVTGRRLAAWVAAMFFAVYARHEEAVMWISANNSTILSLNCLVFFLFWELHLAGKRPRLSYFMALATFVVALFSKESAVMMVPLSMLRTSILRHSPAEVFKRTWPLLAICAAFVFLWLSQASRNFFVTDGHYAFGFHFFPVYIRVLLNLLSSATPFVAVLLLLGRHQKGVDFGKALSWRAISRNYDCVFFLIWIALTVVPVSFLTYSKYIPSRNTYLPSIGLAALVGIIFAVLVDNMRSLRARSACGLLLTGVLAWNVNFLWRRQDAEYVKRAAPTRALILLLNSADLTMQRSPVSVCGFPLHSSIGIAAVANFTKRPVEDIRFLSNCREGGDGAFAQWDEAGQRYVTSP